MIYCLTVLLYFAAIQPQDGVTLPEEWKTAIQAEHRYMDEQSRWFRLKTTHDFLRVSSKIRSANAAINVDVAVPTTEESEVAVLGRWTLEKGRNRHGTEYVSGQNNKYTFRIEKPVGAASYQIVRLEYVSADDSIDHESASLRSVIFPECHAKTAEFAGLTTDSAFKISNFAETIGNEGQVLKRIEFDFFPSGKPDKQIGAAFVECDPNNRWRIVRGGGRFGKFMIDCEFTNTFPAPEGSREMTTLFPVTDDAASCRRTVNAVAPLDRKPNKAEFFLAYYGLREPGVAATSSIRWIVLVIVGVVIIWFSIRWGKGRAVGR